MERNVFNQEEWFPTISAKSIEGTHELNGTDTKQTEYFWVFEIPNLHDTYSSAEYEPSYSTHSARDS